MSGFAPNPDTGIEAVDEPLVPKHIFRLVATSRVCKRVSRFQIKPSMVVIEEKQRSDSYSEDFSFWVRICSGAFRVSLGQRTTSCQWM